MLKLVLVSITCLLLGGAAGFFGGSKYSEDIAQKILQEKTNSLEKETSSCKEEKLKIETDFKNLESQLQLAQEDLKLNESRLGFITSATLQPPEFDPPDLEPLTSNSNGEVLLKWSPVRGAKKYNVIVEDKEGKQVHMSEVEGETYLYINIAVKSSEGADYFARISAVNGLDQASPLSPQKPIHFNPKKFTPKPGVTKKGKQKLVPVTTKKKPKK